MIKNTTILNEYLKKIKFNYNRKNEDKIQRSLALDIRTRWNSTYKMLDGLYDHRMLIMDLFQNKSNIKLTKQQLKNLNCLEFTSDCWFILELLIKVLRPFYTATKAISGSEYPSVGLTVFVLRRIESDFLSVSKPTDPPLLIHMKECLLNKFIYYNMIKDPSQAKTISVCF